MHARAQTCAHHHTTTRAGLRERLRVLRHRPEREPPSVQEDAPAAPELRRCFERRPMQRPTAEELAQAFTLLVPEGRDNAGMADEEAIAEGNQENARLRWVHAGESIYLDFFLMRFLVV